MTEVNENEILKDMSRRNKSVLIPENDIIEIMQKHCAGLDLPEGCIVTGVHYDLMRSGWLVRLCNSSFEPLQRFQELEIIEVKERKND